MKADYDSFEVFNNIIKERTLVQHVMLGSVGQNTDTLKAWSCKECADEGFLQKSAPFSTDKNIQSMPKPCYENSETEFSLGILYEGNVCNAIYSTTIQNNE